MVNPKVDYIMEVQKYELLKDDTILFEGRTFYRIRSVELEGVDVGTLGG